MIKLEISHSLESETERVFLTLKKLEWYLSNGYRPILPKGLQKDSTLEQVTNAVSAEYTPSEYKAFAQSLLKAWHHHAQIIEKLEKGPLSIKGEYKIVLTKYGVGGSYDASTDTIRLNIKPRLADEVVGIILHEIVHMALEPLIEKYNVSHWRKERLVDLIGNTFFPEIRKPQTIQEDISVVDEKYRSLYPDIEAIAKGIAE